MDIYQILESLRRVEESLSDADLLIQDIVNGRVDIYDVYANPKDEVEKYVSEIIHKYYDEIVIDTGLHAKDDFEPIFDRVVDQLQKEYKVEFDESDDAAEAECDAPMSLTDRLRNQWEKTKREKGLVEVGMTTGGMSGMTTGGTQNPGAQDQADPVAVAKQKTDMQKSLQGIPGIDANKAVTDLTNPKDVSGINVAIANALSNPATAQKAKDLLATGMKTGQPGGV
jgi:hypothetical protein